MMTTTLTRPENTPTGDEELDELLSEARRITGMNWQCNVVTKSVRRLFRKTFIKTEYWLVVYTDSSTLPWRMIEGTYGDLDMTRCYLCGLILGVSLNA